MHFSLPDLQQRLAAIFEFNGVLADAATSVAKGLVAAEAAGQSSHGLRRVVAYVSQVRAGKVRGDAKAELSQPRPAFLSVDAHHGFAFPALDVAVEALAPLAHSQGIAAAAIHRSHHAGVLALTVERFAEQGLMAIMFANAPASMAAWGGKRPLFGTNPIAFALPLPKQEPIVIDLALSKVARGKVMEAQQRGVPIPDDWALDEQGNPTTDANAAIQGTMAPAGGAKGAALALMVEVLSASLTGAQYSFESSSLFDDRGGPPALGHFIIAIDPTAAAGPQVESRIALLAAEMAREPGVRLPGRRGQTARAKASQDGLEIEDSVMQAIERLQLRN